MSAGAVGERYAQAIFELAVESGQLAELVERLSDFAATYDASEELQATLTDPLLPEEDRNRILTEVARRAQVPDLGIRALLVMAARDRLPALRETVRFMTTMFDEREGILRAQVTTAHPMPESYYDALTAKIQDATKRRVVLEHAVDGSLVAGAVARIGDSVIDTSVRGRLFKFEQDVINALTVESR